MVPGRDGARHQLVRDGGGDALVVVPAHHGDLEPVLPQRPLGEGAEMEAHDDPFDPVHAPQFYHVV